MAQHLVKACRKGGPRGLLSPLPLPASWKISGDGLSVSTPTSHLRLDSSWADRGSGLSQTSRCQHRSCFWRSCWRSLSEHRFFSAHGGSEEGEEGENKEGEDEEELSADEDGEEVVSEGGDEEDALQLASDASTPLPNFQDSTEEAAYIGYKVVGRIKAGDFERFKAPKAFAIVQVGSHQFKISPGDCIYTEKLKFADVNDKLSLEKVLLLGSNSQTVIGRPFVPKAFVHAAVEEQVLDAKVIIFKKKRRKNYRRTTGHRQELTRLRILEIWGLGEARLAAA